MDDRSVVHTLHNHVCGKSLVLESQTCPKEFSYTLLPSHILRLLAAGGFRHLPVVLYRSPKGTVHEYVANRKTR